MDRDPPSSHNSSPMAAVDPSPLGAAEPGCEQQAPGDTESMYPQAATDAIDQNVGVSYCHSSDYVVKAEAGVVDVSMGLYAGDDNFVAATEETKVASAHTEDQIATLEVSQQQQEASVQHVSPAHADATAGATQHLEESLREDQAASGGATPQEYSGQLPSSLISQNLVNPPTLGEQHNAYSGDMGGIADAAGACAHQYEYSYQQNSQVAASAPNGPDTAMVGNDQSAYQQHVPVSHAVTGGTDTVAGYCAHQQSYQQPASSLPLDAQGANAAVGLGAHYTTYPQHSDLPAAPPAVSSEPYAAQLSVQQHAFSEHTYQELPTSAPVDALGVQQPSGPGHSQVAAVTHMPTAVVRDANGQPMYEHQAAVSHMDPSGMGPSCDGGALAAQHLTYQHHTHIAAVSAPADSAAAASTAALASHTSVYLAMPSSAPADVVAVQDCVSLGIQEPSYEYQPQHVAAPISADSGGLHEASVLATQGHTYQPQSPMPPSYEYMSTSLPLSTESLYSATADAGCSTRGYAPLPAPAPESKTVTSQHVLPHASSHVYIFPSGEMGATSSHVEVQQPYSGSAGCLLPEAAITYAVDPATARSRWKPNASQKSILEAHFNAGYVKASDNLHAQVMANGAATVRQIAVWLKNRAARSKPLKKQIRKLRDKAEEQSEGKAKLAKLKSAKRMKPNIPRPDDKKESVSDRLHKTAMAGLGELQKCLMAVDCKKIDEVVREIKAAKQIFCYGVGREALAMRGFVTRLQQLRVQAYFIGDPVCPAMQHGDILAVSAGPSYYATIATMCEESRKQGGRVVAFTSHNTAPLAYADSIVRIPSVCPAAPGPTDALASADKPCSVFLLGGQYELALQITLDCMASMMFEESEITESELSCRAPNIC